MEFSRQEYWSGLPFPSPGDLPDPGMESRSPALQADSLPGKPLRRTQRASRFSKMKTMGRTQAGVDACAFSLLAWNSLLPCSNQELWMAMKQRNNSSGLQQSPYRIWPEIPHMTSAHVSLVRSLSYGHIQPQGNLGNVDYSWMAMYPRRRAEWILRSTSSLPHLIIYNKK